MESRRYDKLGNEFCHTYGACYVYCLGVLNRQNLLHVTHRIAASPAGQVSRRKVLFARLPHARGVDEGMHQRKIEEGVETLRYGYLNA